MKRQERKGERGVRDERRHEKDKGRGGDEEGETRIGRTRSEGTFRCS